MKMSCKHQASAWSSLFLSFVVHGILFTFSVEQQAPEVARLSKIRFVVQEPVSIEPRPETKSFHHALPRPPCKSPPKMTYEKLRTPIKAKKIIAKKPPGTMESRVRPVAKPVEKTSAPPSDVAKPARKEATSFPSAVPVGLGAVADTPIVTSFDQPEGPRFKKRVFPEYPLRARRMGKQGVVVLELHINAKGELKNAYILENPGYGLDAAAMEAIKKSTFLPARHEGKTVASRARINIRFIMQ